MKNSPTPGSRPPALASVRFRDHVEALRDRSLSEIFTYIYRTNLWGGAESRSGVGSALDPTRRLQIEIPRLCRELGIALLLDVPCGDFVWLGAAELDVEYIGIDIVGELVEDNNRRYASTGARRSFLKRDLTRDPLPQADLVLCRDGLVHLSFTDVFKAFANLKRSRSRYLLTTTFSQLESNVDILNGDWRPLNLQKPPFSLPAPLRSIVEGCTEEGGAYADKMLGLWEISCLPGMRTASTA